MGRINNTGIPWRSGSPEEKAKMREYQRNYKKRKGELYKRVQKQSGLKSKYGMSLEEYEILFDKQRGLCAICGNESQTGKMLSVDHCHGTGKIRGLLCHKCNSGIGMFNENRELIIKAAEYLQ